MSILSRLAARLRRLERQSRRSAFHLLDAVPSLPLLAWAAKYLAPAFPDPPSRFHLWLADELDGMRTRRGQRLSVQAPRGAAKSSWASFAYPLREALEGREPFIVITSDTSGQAQTFLRQIRSQVEDNELIRRDYPQASGKGPIWRDNHIRLRNGVEILALGTGGKIRGRKSTGNRRPTLCLVDDPQNKDHIVSPLQRERSWEWLTKDVLSAGEPTTNYVVLGTALHRECIVCRLAQTPGWRSQVFRSVITWPERLDLWREWEDMLHDYDMPDEEREQTARAFYDARRLEMELGAQTLWPERENTYSLMSLRASIGANAFASEKMNDPVNPEMCEWPPELFDWPGILFHDWPDKLTVKTIAWDPSKGRQDKLGDYSAIVLFGRDKEGREYMECDAARGRSVELMCATLVEHVRDFRPDAVAIEANTFQELIAIPLRIAAGRAGVELPSIHMIDNHVPKPVRIRRLGAPLSQKRIRFKARSPGTQILMQQAKDWGPPGVADDCCFVAGTMIETDRGPRPIESVQPGDFALTRFGYRPVILSGRTGMRQTITVEAENGATLQGTPDHPVYSGMTFVPMRSARIMWSCHEHTQRASPKQSSGEGSCSVDIQTRSNGHIGCTSRPTLDIARSASRRCTRNCGRTPLGRSQSGRSFTTRTAILSTTTSAIWNALPRLSTVGFIERDGAGRREHQRRWPSWIESDHRPPHGTVPRKGSPGTVSMAREVGTVASPPFSAVSTATKNTTHWCQPVASSAQPNAGSDPTRLMVAMRAVSVVARAPGPVADVFNLTVDGGEYFANGFLVHNCDAAEMSRRLAIELTNNRTQPRRQNYSRVSL